ncbi:SAM-dependent chlorinase/fluorinase [Phaeovibrio sulfidiphilus]|uniref:SAM-dependent chlorinase/fluorinase n=1 Tax=Phaeovibrio sulfidiphilus TaxID=1220600 RepID=A0A8J6YJQ6_9PROT|nr:SAM-dependent chlorinase/fluorinase [Phaeovibrio sulfidiphilus]MBE1237641.1 SAM-dependent chlorinase/fluorinase [Phaeovibrio sulfidiphilus]
MILLATDFGTSGLYTGQMRMVLAARAPSVPVIELFADLPAFDPFRSSYLLSAYGTPWSGVPGDAVVIGVVDPGVGSARAGVLLRAGSVWYVGPDNGLFSMIVRHGRDRRPLEAWQLPQAPGTASATFHGRDVFAPVAAGLAAGQMPEGCSPIDPITLDREDWPEDLPEIVRIDPYGNAITGLRAASFPGVNALRVGPRTLARARTFSDVPEGAGFFYANANGLLEIAVNRGRADETFGLRAGSPVTPELSPTT